MFLCLTALVLAGLSGCGNGSKNAQDELVPRQLLDTADLQMNWQVNLPIKKNEEIDRMCVLGDFLYVLTSRNYLFCIAREEGITRFGLELTAPGLPLFEPDYYDGKLWFVVGSKLLVLDPGTGVVTESKKLNVGKGAACKAVLNSTHLFVAGADRRLHAINVKEKWQDFAATADNDSLITSVIADDNFLIFTTKAGNVVSIAPDKPKKRWQYDVSDKITAPIARDGIWLYVGSEDTKLYKLNITTGKAAWKAPFHTGSILFNSAVPGRKVVYQYAGETGLYAIDKNTGTMQWQLKEALGLLAEVNSTAYVFARPGSLVIMDNQTGKKGKTIELANVSDYAVNTTDSTVYVADDKGRVMSIEAEKLF